ncbi:hypothetical protein [Desulfolucanica intricata]|uniref:hypothetical protein n=1 Tax=Desulfolucanica intricata TaxID=1285191 RepID=UPI000834B30E|nr:hypothetical protein [Desulfolucanica intricata]
MKKVIIGSLLIGSLLFAGCANTNSTEQPTNPTKTQVEETQAGIKSLSFEGINHQEELKELLGHSAFIIGAVLSHNYFGDVGPQDLWQNAQRTHLRFDYLKFHKLYGDELLNPENLGNTLWQIDEAYLKVITTMEMKQLDNGRFQTDREGLKESFGFFSEFLTEETFKEHYSKSDADKRFKQFNKYAENNFEYKEGIFE